MSRISTRADGRPSYEHFKGRIRQSEVNYERGIRQRYADLVAQQNEPCDLPDNVAFLGDQQTNVTKAVALIVFALAVGTAFFAFLPQ